MLGSSLIRAALAAFLGIFEPAPQACRTSCEAIASATDRQTCLLQCDQHEPGRDTGGVTRTHTEERKGGAPPGSAHEFEGGSTTTVETTAPGGTRKTTTKTNKRGTAVTQDTGATTTRPAARSASPSGDPRVASNQQAAGPWIVLAGCQRRCDPEAVPLQRAACKLQCLDASPGIVRRVRPRAATRPAK